MRTAIGGCDSEKGESRTALIKHQAAKGALSATFDHLKENSSNLQVAKAAVQEHMKFILRNCIQRVLEKAEKSTETYHSNVGGYISS